MRILIYDNILESEPNPELYACMLDILPDAELIHWHPGILGPFDYALAYQPSLEVMQSCYDVRAFFTLSAGVDHVMKLIDILPQDAPIIRLEDAGMGILIAEYTVQATLRYFRRLDEYAKQAAHGRWKILALFERGEFTVGVMGLGEMGQAIIKHLKPFGFPLCGFSRSPKIIAGVQTFSGSAQLQEFMSACRLVVAALPLTPDTRHILNLESLRFLPHGAYLINVGRGELLAESDLLDLINSGHISAATLDTFPQEPLPAQHPFWQEPRISITPHISARTPLIPAARQIATKIAALEAGRPITGIVQRNLGY